LSILSLHARLLCACNCAYEIGEEGLFSPVSSYRPPIGFAPGVQAILQKGLHACLVGSIPEGILIAFRGTLNPFGPGDWIRDWVHDFEVKPVSLPGQIGSIHSGFWSALETLWPLLTKTLDAIDPQLERPLFLTGHSKGGALATLAAWRARSLWNRPVGEVVTFASPRVGDGAFRKTYEAAGIAQTRYEYGDDLVPHLPPDLRLVALLARLPNLPRAFPAFDYQHVGKLLYLAEGDALPGDSLSVERERVKRLARLLAKGPRGLAVMVAAHARIEDGIARASRGYEQAVGLQL
jgi:hypothetical protein